MDGTREPSGVLASLLGIGLLIVGFFVFGAIGQKAWSYKTELTRSFEQCMESAPFKTSLSVQSPETVLSAEELQKYFVAFDRIFKEMGLPTIWNGKILVPWRVFHKDSIEFARQCHVRLGIDQP